LPSEECSISSSSVTGSSLLVSYDLQDHSGVYCGVQAIVRDSPLGG
jgi:hypothetical protein